MESTNATKNRIPSLFPDIQSGMSNEELLNILNSDTLDFEAKEALLERVLMKRKEEEQRRKILENHKPTIKYLKRGLWYTRIDGQMVRRKEKKDLEDLIVQYYLKNEVITFKDLFEEAEDYYLNIKTDPGRKKSGEQTRKNHFKQFNRCIAGRPFELMDIRTIGKKEIMDLMESVIKDLCLTHKAFVNLKGVINKTFDYAVLRDFIEINPMLLVPWKIFNQRDFVRPADIRMRGYTYEEIGKMLEFTQELEIQHPADSRPWAYEFHILTAERRGEAPPLEWDDICWEKGFIYIHKELVGDYPYFIKDIPKNDSNRNFPLTEELIEFLKRLKENNEIYHPGSKFLFPNEKQPLGCMSLGGAYKIHEKVCKALGIEISKNFVKGTHAFRRVHETTFLEENGSSQIATTIYGHTEDVIKQNYLLAVNAKLAAPTVSTIQSRIINECTRVHKNNRKMKNPESV